MSTFKYPFIALVILSLCTTLWFSSRLFQYSTLIVDTVVDEPSEILPFYRNSLDSSERSFLLQFIDDTTSQAKKLLKQRNSKNSTRIISTAVRNVEDTLSFGVLTRRLASFLPNDFYIVVFVFEKNVRNAFLEEYNYCNTTFGLSQCWLRYIDLSEYSNYLAKNVMYQLYKPLLIRLLLLEYDIVIWLDPLSIPSDNFAQVLNSLTETTEAAGAVFVPAIHGLPTSAFTHSEMFRYFGLKSEAFFFHRMISSRFFILSRRHPLHINVTNDWMSCCADPDCVWPLGARASGCSRPQPEYRYTGCHAGEQSALNVALFRSSLSSGVIYHASDSSLWFVPVQDWNKTKIITTTQRTLVDDFFDSEEVV